MRIDSHGRVVTPWWRREITLAEALIVFGFGFACGLFAGMRGLL